MNILRLVLSFLALLAGGVRASSETARSVVPMTLTQSDYGGGRIYLPVRFGNFLGAMRLDTGASTTRVTLADWNKGLPSLGESVSTGASGRSVRCEDVEATLVALKAAQGADIARAKHLVSRCAESDGDDLLGLSFFKGARFTLDFRRREMVFFGDASAARRKAFRLLGAEQRLVGVDFRVGKETVAGLFDTGAEICAVDAGFVAKHPKLFTLVKSKGRASEAGGKEFAHRIYKIKEIDLGEGRKARDVFAISYDFGVLREVLGRETPFILGYNLIGGFTWDLDFGAPGSPTWDARPR